MRLLVGTTPVPTAGTRVQLRNTADDVVQFMAHVRAANAGRMFVGLSDVSATVNGWELERPVAARPISEIVISFPSVASVKMNLFYVDSTDNGDIIDWIAIVR